MTIAPVLLTPAPKSQPDAYSAPQPGRHLEIVHSIETCQRPTLRRRSAAQPAHPSYATPTHPHLPPAREFARSYFTALSEVMVGRRSADQLAKRTTLAVQQWIRTLTPRRSASAAPMPAPIVRAVHVCDVRDGVVEATSVIQHGPHVRAMNARFLGIDGIWQCTHLELV